MKELANLALDRLVWWAGLNWAGLECITGAAETLIGLGGCWLNQARGRKLVSANRPGTILAFCARMGSGSPAVGWKEAAYTLVFQATSVKQGLPHHQ